MDKDFYSSDVFLGILPFYHIYAMTMILNVSLVLGVKTVTLSRFELDKYLDVIQKHRVTYLHLVPPIALGNGNF